MRKTHTVPIGIAAGVLVLAGATLTAATPKAAVPADVNPNPVAAGPYHEGNILCNRDNQPMLGIWTHHCPSGWHYRVIDTQDLYDRGAGGIEPTATATLSETAPALALYATPTASTVALKWSLPTVPSGQTLGSFVVQWRLRGGVWNTALNSPAAESTRDNFQIVIDGGVQPNTEYDFRVRGEYTSGQDGPWSNVLQVKTATVD